MSKEHEKKVNFGQKEKRRRKLQKEFARKPRFKMIFGKNIIIAVLVAMCVCVMGLLVVGQIYVGRLENRMYEIFNAGQYYIESLHDTFYGEVYDEKGNEILFGKDEKLTDAVGNAINYTLDDLSVGLDCYMALYDNRDNSLVADASQDIYMVNRAEKMSGAYGFQYGMFVLDVEQIEKRHPGLIDEIDAKVAIFNAENEEIYYYTCDGVGKYYSGGRVIPEVLQIYCSPDKIIGWSEQDQLIETYDLSEVDTTGYRYEYTPVEEQLFRTCFLKSGYDSEHIQYQYYNQNIQNSYDVRARQEATVFGLNHISSETIRFGNREMTLVVSGTYNMFYDYKREIMIGCCLVLLCMLLISSIVSYISYLQKKERYEIEMYRRSTTNAMAHDLKSPLMAISAYAENLVSGENPEKNEYYGESILDTVNYMDQVIANILNLSKIENGSMRLNKEIVNLRELLVEHLSKYELLMKERNLRSSLSGECEQECDRVWMTQLIDNLLSNAVKYAKDYSIIEIELTKESITIKNSFEGELDKQPEELTESFVKGDNARSNNQGTGIGLAIVKNVVEAHGFHLELAVVNCAFIVKVIF